MPGNRSPLFSGLSWQYVFRLIQLFYGSHLYTWVKSKSGSFKRIMKLFHKTWRRPYFFQNSEEKLESIVAYADIFLVLYSITDRSSFHEAGKIVKYIRRHRTLDSSSIIIAGTKRDLEHFRTVRETDGSRLTYSLNCGFFEISISESYGDTIHMFNDILRQYLNAHPPPDPSSMIPAPHSPIPGQMTQHKEMKTPSSWAKVKGLKTMPFRRKSAQAIAC